MHEEKSMNERMPILACVLLTFWHTQYHARDVNLFASFQFALSRIDQNFVLCEHDLVEVE